VLNSVLLENKMNYNILLLIITSVATAFAALPLKSDGCGKSVSVIPGVSTNMTVMFEGEDRFYRLHLPSKYNVNIAYPVLYFHHGYGETASAIATEAMTGLSDLSDINDFIVIYPEALTLIQNGVDTGIKAWGFPSCNDVPNNDTCTSPWSGYSKDDCTSNICEYCTCNNDTEFIDHLMDVIEDTYCIDLRRNYVSGFSQGGVFTHHLSCILGGRIAAIAPTHGQQHRGFNCAPTTSRVSIMHTWGTQDQWVPADGKISSDKYYYLSASDVVNEWTTAQGCGTNPMLYPTVLTRKGFSCTEYDSCTTGSTVVSCSWIGGHWWPTNNPSDITEFSREMITFLLSQSK